MIEPVTDLVEGKTIPLQDKAAVLTGASAATRERVLPILEDFVDALKVNRDSAKIDGDQDWLTDALRDSWISIGERLIEEERAEMKDPAE